MLKFFKELILHSSFFYVPPYICATKFKTHFMKKTILVLAVVFAAVAAQAQVSFGVKAGANFSTLGGDDYDEVDGKKSNTGFHFGGFANIGISDNFAFQPELVYSAKQGMEYRATILGQNYELNVNLNYLNLPLMMQYRTHGFYAEAGPQVGFLLTAKSKAKSGGVTEEEDIKEDLKGIDFGVNLGLGYELKNGLGIGARYNFGMSNIADDDNSDVKNRVLSVGLFYKFGGKKSSK